MVFGLIGDVLKGAAKIVGAVTGPIIGLSVDVVAETLKITKEMAQEAMDAGCETYEDIKEFFDLR